MGANFTPKWNSYKDLKPFRFWCQKVLPTVYDDSLSYYELLCKVVNYLNVVIENLEGVEENTDALLNAFNQLQGYVNEYFEDVLPQLVDDKIDELVTNGTFDTIVNNILQPYYADMEEWKQQVEDDLDARMDEFEDSVGDDVAAAQAAANSASGFADESEAWARGTVGGVAVGSDAEQYQNNSKYYAEQAAQAADNATHAEEAQAWATGEVDGVPVGSDAEQYHNNAKYYAEQAAQAADDATHAEEAQAWATGEVDGVPVGSSDPQYHNNAKYYADEAASAATTAATAAVNTAVASLQTQLDTVREVALEGLAWVKVRGVEVKANRTLNLSGITATMNIPGLICITLPYSDSGTGSSTLVDSNSNVEMFKKGSYIFDAQATGTNMLRTNKYLIQELSDGYSNGTTIDGVDYDNHFFTVWNYTTGSWAADGTTIDLTLLVGKIRYKNNGTAINTATVGN